MRKSTNDAINWLCKNRRKNIAEWANPDFLFDFPEYANMPKIISNRLTSDAVDAIQNCWDSLIVSAHDFRYSMKEFNEYDI